MFEQAQANTSIGTAYIYDEDGSLLGEYDNGSAKAAGRTEYIWLPTEAGQPVPVGILRNGNFFAIHSDHLGTPRLMTNEDNKPVWQWPYSAFGANKPTGILQATPNPRVAITNQPVLLKATAATELNQRFPGQYFDSETNLHYNYFRSYQPNQVRYTQADPIGIDGGLSRFGYVGGNALLLSDPLGLDPWCRDPSLNVRVPMPRGKGGGCGDATNDNLVPDLYPEACYRHDSCYANPGDSRAQCDRRFLVDMIVESGPQMSVIGPLIYYGAVRLFGRRAFERARQ